MIIEYDAQTQLVTLSPESGLPSLILKVDRLLILHQNGKRVLSCEVVGDDIELHAQDVDPGTVPVSLENIGEGDWRVVYGSQ